MQAHPPRAPDPQVGGYPVTDMKGLWSVQREVGLQSSHISINLYMRRNLAPGLNGLHMLMLRDSLQNTSRPSHRILCRTLIRRRNT